MANDSSVSPLSKIWRNNSLSIVLVAIILLFLGGESIAGWRRENDERRMHSQPAKSFVAFLRDPVFLEATAENWESEFLEMGMYVFLTVFLRQKGSAESKDPDNDDDAVNRSPDPSRPGAPSPVRRGGWRLALYKNSLTIALLSLFFTAFCVHATASWRVYVDNQVEHGVTDTIHFRDYLHTSQLWFESFQNWQSEFVGVLTIVVLSIYLRQHGSPESKPVDAAHSETGDN